MMVGTFLCVNLYEFVCLLCICGLSVSVSIFCVFLCVCQCFSKCVCVSSTPCDTVLCSRGTVCFLPSTATVNHSHTHSDTHETHTHQAQGPCGLSVLGTQSVICPLAADLHTHTLSHIHKTNPRMHTITR